jgi:abortive infection bacteriophage resistance protein
LWGANDLYIPTHKVFKTYDEQISLLQSRGLVIRSVDTAKNQLKQYGYYNLINGYKDQFLNKRYPETYHPGTTFDEIVSLYAFDYNLRSLLLEALFLIEKNVKSNISYVFSSSYGEAHQKYLNAISFNTKTQQDQIHVRELIQYANETIEYFHSKGNNAITHYLNVHGYIPLWVLFTVFSFGQASTFYANLKDNEQVTIGKEYHLGPRALKSILYFLTNVRNICAHGERLYTCRIDKKKPLTIPNLRIHKLLNVHPRKENNFLGTNDILAVLICFKYLLPPKVFSGVMMQVLSLEGSLNNKITSTSIDYILNVSGLHPRYVSALDNMIIV